ncbi:MAG: response regulator [Candidatus Doudnabacteria bacterium]|nr:response regulator [Candidatus Doudnabacteria bacterium]
MPSSKTDKIKILLAEDDRFLIKVLRLKLIKAGFEVLSAVDGEEAAQKILAEKPDLVLLDIIMPKKNGFEVLAELRNNPDVKDIPVIILSNLGQDKDVEQGKKLGATDYLIKTDLSLEEVVEKVNKYV